MRDFYFAYYLDIIETLSFEYIYTQIEHAEYIEHTEKDRHSYDTREYYRISCYIILEVQGLKVWKDTQEYPRKNLSWKTLIQKCIIKNHIPTMSNNI